MAKKLTFTKEQEMWLKDIIVDHNVMIQNAIIYGENAKQELNKMVEAATDAESRDAAVKGLEALEKDIPLVMEASRRFDSVKAVIYDYFGIDAKKDGITGDGKVDADGEEQLHPVGEESQASNEGPENK